MPYGNLLADVVQSSTTGTPPQFNDGNSTQIGTLCRAWVNFNGTGTVAIRGSFNVSSITDNGTGDYTINFTNAMPDTNYNVTGSANRAASVDVYLSGIVPNPSGQLTSSCRIGSRDYNSTQDCVYCNVSIFR
jgi:hypothetical protein